MPRGRGVRRGRGRRRSAPYTATHVGDAADGVLCDQNQIGGDNTAATSGPPSPHTDDKQHYRYPYNLFSGLVPPTDPIPTNTADFSLSSESISFIDDDLSIHVPAEICQQIWLGRYVDLGSLLKNDRTHMGSNLFVNERGIIEIRQKTSRKITCIREWTDAFIVFTAVYLKKNSQG